MIEAETEIRRLVATGPNRVAFLREPGVTFPPGPNEIRVALQRSLISAGTELAKVAGLTGERRGEDWSYNPLPLGYSATCTVTGVGPCVDRIHVGNLVSAKVPHASRAVVSIDHAWPLPANVTMDEGTFGTLLALALHIVSLSEMKSGQPCAVIGFGIVGQLTAMAASVFGASRVAVYEHRPLRRELACRLGFDLGEPDETFDLVFEAGGTSSALNDALRFADVCGRVVVAGSVREKVEVDVYRDIHLKGLIVIGAHGSTQQLHAGGELANRARGLELIAQGRIDVQALVSHRLCAEEGNRAMKMLDDKVANAIVLDWSRGNNNS